MPRQWPHVTWVKWKHQSLCENLISSHSGVPLPWAFCQELRCSWCRDRSNTWKQGPFQIGNVTRMKLVFYLLTQKDAGGSTWHRIFTNNWHLLKKQGSRGMRVHGWKRGLRGSHAKDWRLVLLCYFSVFLCPCAPFFLCLLCMCVHTHTHPDSLFSRLNSIPARHAANGIAKQRFFLAQNSFLCYCLLDTQANTHAGLKHIRIHFVTFNIVAIRKEGGVHCFLTLCPSF